MSGEGLVLKPIQVGDDDEDGDNDDVMTMMTMRMTMTMTTMRMMVMMMMNPFQAGERGQREAAFYKDISSSSGWCC